MHADGAVDFAAAAEEAAQRELQLDRLRVLLGDLQERLDRLVGLLVQQEVEAAEIRRRQRARFREQRSSGRRAPRPSPCRRTPAGRAATRTQTPWMSVAGRVARGRAARSRPPRPCAAAFFEAARSRGAGAPRSGATRAARSPRRRRRPPAPRRRAAPATTGSGSPCSSTSWAFFTANQTSTSTIAMRKIQTSACMRGRGMSGTGGKMRRKKSGRAHFTLPLGGFRPAGAGHSW